MKLILFLVNITFSFSTFSQPTYWLEANLAYSMEDTANFEEKDVLIHCLEESKEITIDLERKTFFRTAKLSIPNTAGNGLTLKKIIGYDTIFVSSHGPRLEPNYEFMFIDLKADSKVLIDSLYFQSGFFRLENIPDAEMIQIKREKYVVSEFIKISESDSLMNNYLFRYYQNCAHNNYPHQVLYTYYLKKAAQIKSSDDLTNRLLNWLSKNRYDSGSYSRRVISIQKTIIESDLYFESKK